MATRRLGMRRGVLPAAPQPGPGATYTSRIRQALLWLLACPGLAEVAPCSVLFAGALAGQHQGRLTAPCRETCVQVELTS